MTNSKNPADGNAIILITHAFPYGVGEAFLESEIGHLLQNFDEVFVLTKNDSPGELRFAAPNFFPQARPVKSGAAEQAVASVLFLRHFHQAIGYLKDGIAELKSKNKFSTSTLYLLFHDLMKALVIARDIDTIIKQNQLSAHILLYSYWLDSSALALLFVESGNKKITRISRAHRADLYEDQSASKVLSFRTVLAKGLDRIYSVSLDGVSELRRMTGQFLESKIELSRLGTRRPAIVPRKGDSPVFLIVSCSFLARVKRVHLIIEALHLLDLPFHWIHFGDGPERTMLEALAMGKLNRKNYEFRGLVNNSEIISFYEQHYVDIFINTSASEGIPVSIMEAQSFGIPCIGMDAGGVREIVPIESGLLLPVDSDPAKIAGIIYHVLTLPAEASQALRQKTFDDWNATYKAENNFPDFIQKIEHLSP